MKKQLFNFTLLCKVSFLILLILITAGCTLLEEKDIQFVRSNLEDYYASTTPYKEKISIKLSTEEILNGIPKPVKINSIYDTEVWIIKTYEKNDNKEIDILIGLDSHVSSSKGTMLSHFRLNEDNTYTVGRVKLRAFDENGEFKGFASGSGDNEGKYGQFLSYTFEKEDLINRKELFLEISGLYLLNYQIK
ncbi:hypothetical protein IMZ08_18675 [Bacillus luteolus]|uniref:Lipoprotein n=1 Tax=Litchfieldia luteola TaxID=682179 RepID=A0ABR9QNI7_9BACI|nr:hypothetical protein [Cytobacillus luteolus]MBE4910065.1 hypothetical protein [Cytobacillus luteolus]MBP1942372.1 hypothetical protein [Cytobacillus luteolus]